MSLKPEVRERIRSEMRPLIAAWKKSGETRRTFASRHGISLPKFAYWARQEGPRRARPGRPPRPGFAAVAVVPPAETAGVLEIIWARGDRLVVRAGADQTLVRTALAILARRC
jgi:hypothetical protein